VITTLTANPSVDRTVEVAVLERGEVNRATGTHVDPGGKGINVARALAAAGVDARAVLPVGGVEGVQLAALMAGMALEVVTVPIAGSVRANVTIAEPDGTVTKINEPGPALTAVELDALVDATLTAAQGSRWLALCGSLPPGAPPDLYARLVERAHALGVAVAVDASGPALVAAVAATPDLLKPNREELEALTGAALATLGDVLAAARTLVAGGAGAVLASLGADGAVLVTRDTALHAVAPPVTPRSTVGAGDATLAGWLSASGAGAHPAEALRTAVAWGAAAVALPGSAMPTPADVDRDAVAVRDPLRRHPRTRLEGARND
jgi:1-phosphofructokinase